MDEMIDRVLSVCPGCDREDVKSDLNVTGNVELTINHALDGMLSPKNSSQSALFPITTCIMDDEDNDVIDLPPTAAFTNIKERCGEMPRQQSDALNNKTKSLCNKGNKLNSHIQEKHTMLSLENTKKDIFLEISDSDSEKDTPHKFRRNSEKPKSGHRDIVSRTTHGSKTEKLRGSSPDSDSELLLPAFGDDHYGNTSKLMAKGTDLLRPFVVKEDVIPICPSINSRTKFSGESCETRTFSDMDNRDVPGISCQEDLNCGEMDSLSDDNCSEKPPKKKKRSKVEIEEQKKAALLRKEEKEKARQAKLEEKQRQKDARVAEQQQKKIRMEKEKLHKQADKLTKSTMKLDGCVKFMTAYLDPSLFSEASCVPAESMILQKLLSMEANYKIQPRPYPGSITWQRMSVQHSVQEEQLKITSSNSHTEESEVLVVFPAEQFAEMVFSFKQDYHCEHQDLEDKPKTLVEFTRDVQRLFPGKNVSFLLFGLDKYMRSVKTKQKRAFRDAAVGSEETEGNRKRRRKKIAPTVDVTRTDIEEALVDFQIKTNVCVYPCETQDDVAMKIAVFTKAIAEKPYKKPLSDVLGFCLDKLDKTSLKVSKDGQGMVNVWRQQLEQFRNVSRDMAAAIVAEYPSPQLLLQAYKNCRSEKEAVTLLQDILVRRGGGSLMTCKRIGPELSKRFYILFHSRDSNELMKK